MNPFLATIHPLGPNGVVVVTPLSAVDPGFGRPGGPVDPDFGFGTLPHPGHGLPGSGGRPDQGLPGWGGPVDPGYGQDGRPPHAGNWVPGSWGGRPDQGLPGFGHPGNALPIPPVRPSPPIVIPPGTWPPQLPPGANVPDIDLPPMHGGRPTPPIVIPPDPDVGIEQPIYLPTLPPGVALLIAITGAHAPQPKEGTPPAPANTKPAILVQSGKKPVLVYVSAAASPK